LIQNFGAFPFVFLARTAPIAPQQIPPRASAMRRTM
jgi:hypothetical protein